MTSSNINIIVRCQYCYKVNVDNIPYCLCVLQFIKFYHTVDLIQFFKVIVIQTNFVQAAKTVITY